MSKVTSAPTVVAEDAVYLPLLAGHNAYQSIIVLQLSQYNMTHHGYPLHNELHILYVHGKNVYNTLMRQ